MAVFRHRGRRAAPLLFLIAWLLGAGVALGAGMPLPAGDRSSAGARVTAGTRNLFLLYGGSGDLTVEERALIVNRRIDRILRTPALDPRRIRADRLPNGQAAVFLEGLPLVVVTPGDAEGARRPPEELAAEWAHHLRARLTQLQPLYLRQTGQASARTLSEHHVLLLILQVALLLLVARLCGEAALRLGQPPVLGQLLAGILLGQSVLGALWPDLQALLFPVEATQSYLLEVVSWIGVLFLLLLTGLETDVALIRAQGRPALFTAITGVVLPFLLGVAVGYLLPEVLLTGPESRLVLALFLGTVLSVSSVPVIAKILREMQLLRRNVGQLILAAALAHDTVGWLLVGVVASLAAGSRLDPALVGRTVAGTGLFLLLCGTVGRPFVRGLLRRVNDCSRSEHALLSAIILLMLAGAAMTQVIGVHAVLGAFVVGILLREAPVVNERVLHPIETTTTALFAPIFFAAAGLHVDLAALARPALMGYAVLLLAAACLGKVAGCYLGARWGGAPHWEALAVGFGTNARGAMGLIVGILGFSLGILTVDVFSLIILMAVVTTAMSPPLLRWALSRVKPGEAEAERLRQESLREQSFIGRVQRVLIPSRGGEHARLAARLVDALAEHQRIEVTGLYVPSVTADEAGKSTLAALRGALAGQGSEFHGIVASPSPPAPAILSELERGYDLLAMGCGPAAGEDGRLFGDLVDHVAGEMSGRRSGASLLVVRAPAAGAPEQIARILVPTTAALPSVYAAEFAVAVARSTGATVSAVHVYETADERLFWLMDPDLRAQEAGWDAVEQVRSLGEALGVPVATRVLRGQDAGEEILRVAREEAADLIVLGSSPRPTRRLYLGASVGRVVRDAPCAVAVLRA